jgi:alpha-beta hydrolase superfamily lysophospholipase
MKTTKNCLSRCGRKRPYPPSGAARVQLVALGRLGLGLVLALYLTACGAAEAPSQPRPAIQIAKIDSLERLSLISLRERDFAATFTLEEKIGSTSGGSAYASRYGAPFYDTHLMSYRSDGLRVYARVDVPPNIVAAPTSGRPVIVLAHGYVGLEGAPGYRFEYVAGDSYSDLIDRYVKEGYVVVTPGFRGHGTVKGVPAEGIEWLRAYDNGSFLSPVFYAIDILHALQAVKSLEVQLPGLKIDTARLYLTSHSQGGDAALTALAVSSSPRVALKFSAASLWASCVAGRLEQSAYYGAMEASADALTNPAYFNVMPSWWTSSMYYGTIADGLLRNQTEMYNTVRNYVADRANADPTAHPVDAAMARIDSTRYPMFINAPLAMHYSDRDYYSSPKWNEAVVRDVNSAGGMATQYVYPGNSHSFTLDPGWSPAGSVRGREIAIERTQQMFRSN